MPEIYYLKLGSGRDLVLGESRDEHHVGWIKLKSVSISTAQTAHAIGGGSPEAAALLMEINMTKDADQTSTIIFNAVQTGRPFSSAVIDFVDPNTTLPKFRLELKDVMISSFGPRTKTEPTPGDQFTFTFSNVKMNDSPIPDDAVDKALKCSPVPARSKHKAHSHSQSKSR